MKKQLILSAIVTAVLFALLSPGFAQSVTTLRDAAVDEEEAPLNTYQLDEGRFSRNYRQQPPLIPHSIDNYQVDLKANRCLSCHDWTNAAERRAPTLSMTHYQDRDGNQLNEVSGSRWFCTQCHVPQANTPALIDNDFNAAGNN
ncbi:MAG: nitrate reductase cytochrome c-type subunit [Stappiaceae bacterium]